MHTIKVRYYHHSINKAVSAKMSPTDSGISIISEHGEQIFTHSQLTIQPALGQMNPAIEVSNGARIVLCQREIPDWVKPQNTLQKATNKVWYLERSLSIVLVSVVVTLAIAVVVMRFGVPAVSDLVASQLPEDSLSRIGAQVEAQLLRQTDTSTLSQDRQQQINTLYEQYVEPERSSRIHYVQGGLYDANAFALPNGSIFITDELIELTENNYEVLAVLAHERGHIVHKHSIRQSLNMLGVSAIILMITGDLSDFATILPTMMLSMSYSRRFEYEADDYAKRTFNQKNLDLAHISNVLLRLQDHHYEGENDQTVSIWQKIANMFRTHPTMLERTQRINNQQKIVKTTLPVSLPK